MIFMISILTSSGISRIDCRMENAPLSLEYSVDALLEFLEYLAKKGMVNKNTVDSRKASSNKMLAILSPGEAADLRHIDVDQLSARFANLKGQTYSPQSLQVYKSRLNTSLADFFRYKDNPANFKINGVLQKSTLAAKVRSKPVKTNQQTKGALHSDTNPHLHSAPVQVATFNIPVPLRTNCVVQINGLPVDLTKQEAGKISAVIQAMISVENG